jgi:hypothetical protein
MKKAYLITHNHSSPYVISTGQAHRPTQIKLKKFRAGEIIHGELKHANGKPAFILVKGVIVVPLSVVKAVITKDIVTSSAEGDIAHKPAETTNSIVLEKNPKMKFVDAAIVGAIAGVLTVIYAEKKLWIPTPSKENKLIGAGVGAAVAAYFVYRFKKSTSIKMK